MEFNPHKAFDSTAAAGITWLDLERIEERYLLAACADGSLAAFDVARPAHGLSSLTAHHTPVFQVSRTAPGAHTFTVTAALWYPVDTGLFVTASFDQKVQVWDSNHVLPVASFELGHRVYCAAMSPLAHAHALIAAGSGDPAVKLCDTRSGAFTHNLTGHRQAVWAAAWSPSSQWHLATGGCDGQVRMWDIRRAGCIALLDQHDSQPSTTMSAMPMADDWPSIAGVAGEQDVVSPTATSTAHDGRVTALLPTPDGLSWLSAATDSRVRLWSVPHFRNTLVNFPNTHNRAIRARQLAVTEDSRFLFHPSGSSIQVFHMADGQQLKVLRGAHFETINCCVWNSSQQELYSAGNDLSIHVWSPLQRQQPKEALGLSERPAEADEDRWSDDDF